MANQNLSQFGENTSVSNADYTFVWDSAASISKKVSRNSWLNSGTLTSDAPVTISQTWGAVGQTFKAFVVNAAGTSDANSASGSLLLDLQLGGVSRFNIQKNGSALFKTDSSVVFGNEAQNSTTAAIYSSTAVQEVRLSNGAKLGWTSTSVYNTLDTILVRDSASGNTLALRNSTAAQTFNVYGTYTSSTSYERLTLSAPSAANAIIGTNKGSGGGTARGLDLHTDGAARMTITTAGNVGIGTTAPGAPLEIRGTAVAGTRENLLKCTMSDGGNSAFHIYNVTAVDNSFIPGFSGSVFSTASAVAFVGQTTSANDSGTNPLVLNVARLTSSETDPNNGTLSAVATRPLFAWSNLGTTHMQMAANGNLGIGTTSPTSKLHVAETWNNAGTAFCAIKSVITDTNSAAGSDFLELYSGTSTQPLRMDINKTGQINIYGAWTDASNYERLSFSAPSAANAVIGTNKAGTGTARGLEFQTDGVTRMSLEASGNNITIQGAITTAVSNQGIIRAGNNTILAASNDGTIRAIKLRGDAGGTLGWAAGADPSGALSIGLMQVSAGVLALGDGTLNSVAGSLNLTNINAVGNVISRPSASITPAANGDLVVEATSNTTLTFKLKGTDGTVRTGTITLA